MQHRTVEEHVTGLRTAVQAFARSATQAGTEAVVPTCPAWTVRTLLAHQGMVHRWARANLLGQECHPPSWNAEGREVADPVGWLLEGAAALVATIESAPDDVRATVFLKDAPAPRVFWARRQCHETTIHAVDALASAAGRVPTPEDVSWIDPAVALDGIDELLTGFVTRGRARFGGVGPVRFEVRSTVGDQAWSVDVQPDGAVVTTRAASRDAADDTAVATARVAPQDTAGDTAVAPIRGHAVALYLALWNRATPEVVDDPGGILAGVWRERARVRWG